MVSEFPTNATEGFPTKETLLNEAREFVKESNIQLARLHRSALMAKAALGPLVNRGDFEDYDEARLNVWEDAFDRLEAIVRASVPDLSDTRALNEIHKLLDGVEWSPDTLDGISGLVERTGRPIRDIEDLVGQMYPNI